MPWPKATLGTAALIGALTGAAMAVATTSSIKAPELGLLMVPAFFLSFVAYVAGSEGRGRPLDIWGLDPDARAKVLAPVLKRLLAFVASGASVMAFARFLWPT